MNKIETLFGDIYIENLDNRDEFDRIKIYDSDEKYLEYISYEFLEENAWEYENTVEEQYVKCMEYLRKCDSVYAILDYLAVNVENVSMEWQDLTNLVNVEDERDFLLNEFTNRIGNYYIVIN